MEAIIVVILIIFALLMTVIYISRKLAARKTRPFYGDDYDLSKIKLEHIDRMDGDAFELYLYRLLLKLDYDGVYKTLGSRDFGADLVFTDRDGHRNVVQAKRYAEEHPVGLSAVQEIYTSMRYYRAKKAIVLTSSTYTESCETLAGINHVKLLNRNDLTQIIKHIQRKKYNEIQDILESEPRAIYDSWNELGEPAMDIKKDKKAEKYVMTLKK